jgi:hypothetical protein
MNDIQAAHKMRVLRRKIDRFLDARNAAEKAFDKLKYGPDGDTGGEPTPEWYSFCEHNGFTPDSDFGDFTC